MADKATTTKASSDPNDDINAALDKARDAMIKGGMPADQADAMLNAARPSGGGTVVGNYADLQRMGAIAQTGVMPTPPAEEDVKTSDLNEAFVDSSVPGSTDINEDRLAFAHKIDADAPAPVSTPEAELKASAAAAKAEEGGK